jgi:rod shape-determining protein MreC
VVVYQQGNRRRRSILALIVITAVALITLDIRESGPISGLRDGARDVVEPISGGVEAVFSPVGDWIDGIVHSATLSDENAQLRRRLDEQRGKLAEAEAAIDENRDLKDILDIPYVQDEDAITAQVVGGAPGNFEFTVQVDAGSSHGVEPEMTVVTGAGLVGRVSKSSGRRATVVLLRDPESSVRVKLENGAAGFLVGRGDEELLRLDEIQRDIEVKKGDLLTTAGDASSVFPGGVPVGRVAEVENISGELQQRILVEPIVDFSRLDHVKVLPAPTR